MPQDTPPSTSRIGKKLLDILGLLFIVLVLYSILLLTLEKRIIYHPHPYPEGNWNPVSKTQSFEDVWFVSSNGIRIHGWFVAHPEARATLIWFHGNAGNISYRLENILLLEPLKINIFIFDYRGYGKSEGTPSEQGLIEDSLAAYDWVVNEKKIVPETIFLFGRSLGGIFATKVAEQKPHAGLILESTFPYAKDMARAMFSWFPADWFIRAKFNAGDFIQTVTTPKLFLHGTEDEIVPYSLGRKLFDLAPEPKAFYDILGADHNGTYAVGGPDYFKTLNQFVTQHLPESHDPKP